MLIVDAQIHLWNAGNPTSPWRRQLPASLKEHALKEMVAGGVDAAMLTPHTPWESNANDICFTAASSRPDWLAILGLFPLATRAARRHGDTAQACPSRHFHVYPPRLCGAFGPARCCSGTDLTRMPCSWRQCGNLCTEELPRLKGRDLELVMGRAIGDWLVWT